MLIFHVDVTQVVVDMFTVPNAGSDFLHSSNQTPYTTEGEESGQYEQVFLFYLVFVCCPNVFSKDRLDVMFSRSLIDLALVIKALHEFSIA